MAKNGRKRDERGKRRPKYKWAKDVKDRERRTATVVLYPDEQLADLTRFCCINIDGV